MIRSNDLRLGNLVIVREQIRTVTTLSTGKTPICTHVEGCKFSEIHFSESDVEPINLTDEWLLKCGATKIVDQFILDRFRLNYRKDYEFWYVVDVTSLSYLTKIEFVHELQNFYFAMNGQELNIIG